MKNAIFFLATFLLPNLAAAQSPIYLEFSPDCMNRLEYQYRGQGSSIFSYSVRQNENETYVFDIGAESNRTLDRLPADAIACKNLQFNEGIVKAINNGIQKVYIARRTSKGWLVTPAASAEAILREGSTYNFRGAKHAFSFDTLNLDYGINSAHAGSGAYIFFNGRNFYNDGCHAVYSFHREPDEACTTKTDFDFIAGLGTISERTGMTPEEMAENEYRLTKINGMPLDEFLEKTCKRQTIEFQQVETPFAQPATVAADEQPRPTQYSTTISQPVARNQSIGQPDKEAEVQQKESGVAPATYGYGKNSKLVGPPAPINCPEQPGEGYHIVQPGETLVGIARAYGVKLGSVIVWNSIKDPDLITPCQKVYLTVPPGGIKPATDSSTGKVAIATKPSKKSNKKEKSSRRSRAAERPVTHSTENMAAAKPAKKSTAPVQTQSHLWEKSAIATSAPAPVGFAKTAAPVEYSASTAAAPAAQNTAPAPVQYSTSQNSVVQKTTTFVTAKAADVRVPASYNGIVHTVRQGESIYSIAKSYGYTHERFAKMNGLPENFLLQAGMELMTSDCTCDVSGRPAAPATYGWKEVEKTKTETSTTQKSENLQQGFTQKSGSVFTETEVSRPVEFGFTKKTETPNAGHQAAGAGNFKPHFVQSGETLGDIARRWGVTVEDIASTNGLDVSETLIIGMRLMIPQ